MFAAKNCHDAFEFAKVTYKNTVGGHVLHPLLPSRRSESYSLHERRHDYQLSCRQNYVTDKNFITRLLFKDMY